MRGVAFFDFDKTLIAANSANLWLRAEWKRRELSRVDIARAFYWVFQYYLGFSNASHGILQAIGTLRGQDAQEFKNRVDEFYAKNLRQLYRPGAKKALERHQKRGDRVVLLSSVHQHLAELIARDLKMDHLLCTRLEVDAQGTYTGATIGPICFGEGKVHHARELLKELGMNEESCTFYTDSFTDIPMLSCVGEPIVVNPDPRLKKYATRIGWRIEDWGKP